ncbi:inositol monophosphatase [Actinotalea sp. BY-33]|uniref:Inositol monophosphatase n=1 Tax=Actinotalea soli TaxID=2819234 RepID=A0A939RVD5_9CELL|nr:inositol monophosphatase [Actinotalea soli]
MSGARVPGPEVDVDAVTALVEHVAATVVSPRFRELTAGEVSEKSPGDLVTVVDTAAEAALTAGLAEILPGVPVVGEEATSADLGRLALLGEPRVLVVDPLDGTQAFVEGSPDHAVMVGLVEHGEAVAGWICLPQHGQTFVAQRGAGAWCNGERLTRSVTPSGGPLRVGIAGYLPDEVRAAVDARFGGLEEGFVTSGRLWSGYEYSRLALGERDALVYWRTWPWDHVPGAVLVREVGGVSRRLDAADYRPGHPEDGLIAAADPEVYDRVRRPLCLDR